MKVRLGEVLVPEYQRGTEVSGTEVPNDTEVPDRGLGSGTTVPARRAHKPRSEGVWYWSTARKWYSGIVWNSGI